MRPGRHRHTGCLLVAPQIHPPPWHFQGQGQPEGCWMRAALPEALQAGGDAKMVEILQWWWCYNGRWFSGPADMNRTQSLSRQTAWGLKKLRAREGLRNQLISIPSAVSSYSSIPPLCSSKMNTNTLGGAQRRSLTLEPIHMYTPGTFRHIYIHSPKVTLYLLNSDSFSHWRELPCYCTVEAASVSVSAFTTRLQASERPPVS